MPVTHGHAVAWPGFSAHDGELADRRQHGRGASSGCVAARSASGDDPRLKTAPAVTANSGDVARRAYDLYVARGREDGHDVDDWLQAERELQNPTSAGASEAI